MAEGVCVVERAVAGTESMSDDNKLLGLGGGLDELFLLAAADRVHQEPHDEESISSEEDNCRKKRCADRYDSSESSDSGVAVHCGDFGSSNSDITEPCSPLSTTSLEEMPPTQSQPAWLWDEGNPPNKRPKQGKITEYFKTKTKKNNNEKQVNKLISKFLSPSSKPLLLFEEEKRSESAAEAEAEAATTPPTPICRAEPLQEEQVPTAPDLTLTQTQPQQPQLQPLPQPPPQPQLPQPQPQSPPQERTIRFPPKNGWKGHYVSDIVCRWSECEAKFNTTSALIEHLQVKHVNSQTLGEYYVCQWVECKVYERKSCSRTWLERHVLSHGGNKPYRCIVDGCGHRFSSQTLLQRHVNSHFTENNQQGSSKKNCEPTNKLIRRNGKKLRYRRHPFSARVYDYFDTGIMEGLQHNLIEISERRTQGQLDTSPGHTVTLHSKIMGRRTDVNGESKVLLRWFPLNVICDEWVSASSIERTRQVSICSLPSQSKDCLYTLLSPDNINNNRRHKTARKQHPTDTASTT